MTVFGKNRMKKWYIGVIIISIMMPILIVGSIGYWFYSAGRYTLKPGEKQVLKLKARSGIEPTTYITVSGLKGEPLKLTGQDTWAEVVDYDKNQYRYYDTLSEKITAFPQDGVNSLSVLRETGTVEFDDGGITLSSLSDFTFALNAREEITIYFENVSDKTVSFKISFVDR